MNNVTYYYIGFVTGLLILSTAGPGGKTLLLICHHSSTGNLVYSVVEFLRLSCRSRGNIMPLSAQVHSPPPYLPPPLLTLEQSLGLLFLSNHVFFIYISLFRLFFFFCVASHM
jgi:hypothetical protein